MKSKHFSYRQYRMFSLSKLILAMSLAGSSVVVGKIIISSMPVFLGTFLTLLVALLTMLPLMVKRIHEIRALTFREWRYLFLQGLFGIVLFRIFTLYGLHHTGAVEAGIVTGTTPAVLAVLSYFLLKEKLNEQAVIALCCAVAGCIFINVTHGTSPGNHSISGSVLVFFAVISEALFTIFRKKIASSVSAITNTFVLILCSLVVLLIPALYDWFNTAHLLDLRSTLAILYYGIVATVLAYLLWTSAVGNVDGATAGIASAAMPASSVLLASLILGEQLQAPQLFGCAFIIAGIVISSMTPQKTVTISRITDPTRSRIHR